MSYKREADKATFKARGNVAREKVAKWSSYSKWNFENKLLLLEAEHQFTKERRKQPMRCASYLLFLLSGTVSYKRRYWQ